MSAELPAEPAARVAAILERVVEALGLEATVEVEEGPDEIVGRVETDGDAEELGLLIGRRGQTIDAVQLLCYRAAFRGQQDRKRVVVDAGGYRTRRRELIEGQADRAAQRAVETGREIELDPMSPTERKLVHDHLKDRPGIETFSEGDEGERCVIVAPLLGEE